MMTSFSLFSFVVCFSLLLTFPSLTFSRLNPTDCENIYWLHPPKTSSSFCLTLQHFCCKSSFEDITNSITNDRLLENEMLPEKEKYYKFEKAYGCVYLRDKARKLNSLCPALKSTYHRPLPTDFANEKAIMFLRSPKSRLISSFLDALHHEGMKELQFLLLKEKMQSAPIPANFLPDTGNAIRSLIYSAMIYANESAFIGCQTKMILGYQCADSSFLLSKDNINITAIDEAKRRLNQFHFVGIFEEYVKSINLFYKMNHQTLSPNIIELVKFRQTDKRKATLISKHLSYEDPYDSSLYEEALRLFKQNIEKFSVPTSTLTN